MMTSTHAQLCLEQQQQQQELMPQRIKCGEVYSWDCDGELYGVECALCEERPLCTLAEFAEHMDIWHSSWTEEQPVEELDHEKGEMAVDSELQQLEQLEQLEAGQASTEKVLTATGEYNENVEEEEEDDVFSLDSLEPFEQVLIALDTVSTTTSLQVANTEDFILSAEKFSLFEETTVNDEALHATEKEEEEAFGAVEYSLEATTTDGVTIEEAVPNKIDSKLNGPETQLATNDVPVTVANDLCLEDIAMENYEADCADLADSLQYSNEDCNAWCTSEWDSDELSVGEENVDLSSTKLCRDQMEKLIELYRSHTCLWQQNHPKFNDTHLCRKSWQQLTQSWNEYCQRNFTPTEVRIRMSTLCQRYLKERARASGDVNFTYYEQLQFLDEQQTLIDRRQFFEQQNEKLLEVYAHFPVLWHRDRKHLKLPTERETAYRNIIVALKLSGIHLPRIAIQRRLQTLRKYYRSEKMRQLQCQLDGSTFEPRFRLYQQMQFLDEHTEPYVCPTCGKFYNTLLDYRVHEKREHKQERATLKGDNGNKTDVGGLAETEAAGVAVPCVVVEGAELVEQFKELEDVTQLLPNGTPLQAVVVSTTEEIYNAIVQECAEVEKISPTNDCIVVPITTEKPQQLATDNVSDKKESEKEPTSSEQNTSNEMIVKVDCGKYSYNLRINAKAEEKAENSIKVVADMEIEPASVAGEYNADCNVEYSNSVAKVGDNAAEGEETFARLTVEQTHKLIALYRDYAQLWDPRHLDYHCRKVRRIAWRLLTTRLNEIYNMRYSWTTLHRKVSDYLKYYKREKHRIETERSCTKWCFYDDFAFIDEVLVNCSELLVTALTREHNVKIIELYREYPQLWDTHHPEFSKRRTRQQHIVEMCARLKVDWEIRITPDKLKQRLIEFRCSYRTAKAQRLAAMKRNEPWTPQFEFYETMQFIDLHVAPFVCAACGAQFKRLTDFVKHERKQHAPSAKRTRRNAAKEADISDTVTSSTDAAVTQAAKAAALDNVCHICGITFTLRSNLMYHLKRHLNCRTHACSNCPKKFFNSTALRVHERSHTKSKPYMCEQCGRGYVNGSKLNQHMKRHRNQRDFPCSQCGKAFYSAFECERHMRRHLNLRDKVCPICAKAFVVGSAYYTHMLLHSDVKRYACKPCNLQFSQYAGLYKHRKRYHQNELTAEKI